MLLDRRSAPFLAVGAALVVLAGGLVAAGVWWANTCFGGWVGRPVGADVPAAASGPDRADGAAAADLQDVGVDAEVRWGLWQHLDGIGEPAKPVHRDPELRAATVADDLLVTAQRRPGSVEAVPSDTTLVAAYDAITGAPRWRVEGPRARGELRMLAVGGRLLAAGRLTALDTADGAFAWCRDAAGSVVAADAQRVVLAAQDGRESVLRSPDTPTGDERWRVGYKAHDSTLQPVVRAGWWSPTSCRRAVARRCCRRSTSRPASRGGPPRPIRPATSSAPATACSSPTCTARPAGSRRSTPVRASGVG
jgi:hypothetical protein